MRKLWVVGNVLAKKEDSVFRKSLLEDSGDWMLDRQLLAGIFDRLGVLIWQKTKDGQKGRNKPKPLPRPGVGPAVTKYGGKKTSRSPAEIRAYLDRFKPKNE